MSGPDQRTCRSGEHCRALDPVTKQPYPTSDPLCHVCLDHAQPAVRGLVFDFLDLAQLQEPSMSQAINERTGGSKEKPIPISAHVEALQAEIVHVTATWEYELRVACGLHNPATFAPLWRTKVYDHLTFDTGAADLRKARPGALVQRAVDTIAPRLERLSKLPATLVCPAGIDDEPVHMEGWEAVAHLQQLHQRARAALGRTRRTFWIPGECWACGAHPVRGVDGPLYRSEPKFEGDPMQVNCDKCSACRAYPDYETYMATLLWPKLEVAA